MHTNQNQPGVFFSLTKLSNAFKANKVSRESEFTDGLEIIGFLKPLDILISKWYPGYRVVDLSGRFADEAIGILLADTLSSVDQLSKFQRILATPDVATAIFTTLLPRANVPVKNRKYQMSESKIAEVVADVLTTKGMSDVSVRVAYTHACTRVLTAMGIVQPGIERRSVAIAESLAISARDIKRVILTEALRDLFSEARLSSFAKELGEEATPQIIGETVGRMFRSLSHVIPEVKLRLEQLEIASSIVKLYHIARDRVPNALQAHPALVALASFANFIYFAEGRVAVEEDLPYADLSTIKDACNNILSIIQSAPSIESMPMSTYAKFFGQVPAASPDGIRRGLVLYTCGAQTSKMEVIDARPIADGLEIAAVAPEYVRVGAVASSVSSTLLSADAVTGLANVVADELALSDPEFDADHGFSPSLFTMGVTDEDLIYLALASAEAVAYVTPVGNGPARLLYGCSVAEQWRMSVLAASPTMAYFADPAAVIVYQSSMRVVEPQPLPSRNQTISAVPGRDIMYVGDLDDKLITGVEKSFMLKLPVQTFKGDTFSLDLDILVLSSLLGHDPETYPERGGAFYAAVKEPGIDAELANMLVCALAYARDGGNILADRAKSWLVERLAPSMLHPSIQAMAQRALNTAIIKQKIDARALTPQFKEVIVRAYVGTLLAVLCRFNKLTGQVASEITQVIPVSGLTIKSQLTMASMPTAINANFTRE